MQNNRLVKTMALTFSSLGPYIRSLYCFIALYEIRNYKHEYQVWESTGKKPRLSTFVDNTYHELHDVENTKNLCIILQKIDSTTQL